MFIPAGPHLKQYITSISNVTTAKTTTESPTGVTVAGPSQNDKNFSTYPTWAQNFENYGSNNLESKYWKIYKGAPENDNHEAQYYTDDLANLQIKDNALTLTATKQSMLKNYSYASARIDTSGKVSFLYGRIDVTAKIPSGVGTWPAVWLLPNNTKYEDLSPASDTLRYTNGGEIDLFEAVGFNPNIIYGVTHSRHDLSNPNGVGDYNQILVPNNDKNYNSYSVLWTPNNIIFEVNEQPFFTYSKPTDFTYMNWPFDQPFYLIINLALGGSWGGQDTADFPGNGIDNSILPKSFQIKSIYYYPYLNYQQ